MAANPSTSTTTLENELPQTIVSSIGTSTPTLSCLSIMADSKPTKYIKGSDEFFDPVIAKDLLKQFIGKPSSVKTSRLGYTQRHVVFNYTFLEEWTTFVREQLYTKSSEGAAQYTSTSILKPRTKLPES